MTGDFSDNSELCTYCIHRGIKHQGRRLVVNFKIMFVEGIEKEGAKAADLQCSIEIEGKYVLCHPHTVICRNSKNFFGAKITIVLPEQNFFQCLVAE